MGEERKVQISFENKDELFDNIAALYYKQNFGTASKSDIDLLMFKIYLEELIKQNKDSDKNNTIDYKKISDYKIARHLGITPQRVRALKLKKELVYPQSDFDWKDSLKRLLSDERRIRVENKFIKITIPDPCLFLKIQEHIENNSGYVDIQLNDKLLVIPNEDFVELITLILTPEEIDSIFEKLSKEQNEPIPTCKDYYDKALIISEIIRNTTDSVSSIVGLFNPTGYTIKGLEKIIEAFRRKII